MNRAASTAATAAFVIAAMGQDVDQPFSDINPIEEWF